MPELPLDKPRIVADLAGINSERRVLEQMRQGSENGESKAQTLARLYPEIKYVGRGSQVFVIGHPRDDEKVVAFPIYDTDPSRNPIHALSLYHAHRLLHVLFPHNFPHIYSVTGGENAQSVRERINHSPEASLRFPFYHVVDHCRRLGLPLLIDVSEQNFVRGPDGGEYYLETVMIPKGDNPFENLDRSKLVEFMQDQGIGPGLQRRAMTSLERLKELV